MRAAVFEGPHRPLVIDDRPVPSALAGDIVIRVAYCGICGSDLHGTEAGPFCVEAGTVLGHEFVGEVVETRSPLWVAGDRVVAFPVRPCDACLPDGECRDRLGILCPERRIIGMSPAIPGGYAQYARIGGRQVMRIPDELDDRLAALAEPLAVAAHTVDMAGDLKGRRVLVLGTGPIGLGCVVFARRAGAAAIAVSEIDPVRRQRAMDFDADHAIDPAADALPRSAAAALGGPPDVIFECAGVPGILQIAIETAAIRGTVVVAGVCRQEDRFFPRRAIGKELRLQFVLGYDRDDFATALGFLVDNPAQGDRMISRIVGLDALPALFDALRRPNDANKVLISPSAREMAA